jgi:pyruvate/2-oxoglutarate dehydrogenase complex dihydrolipoamide dehydrogenase (E3) component
MLRSPHDAGRRPERRGGAIHADLCVIGAGSAGLSVAAGAAQMGASVVLIERGAMGGDCLNAGCVPSKALIAAAKAAHAQRAGAAFGVRPVEPVVDFAAVRTHVRCVIDAIAPHDSVERFEGLGCTVLRGSAVFVAPDELRVGEDRVRARRFVIATGSRPSTPPIPGLDAAPHLTNESIFDVDALPGRLLVIGGGPIGVELAQAFRRLGSAVTLLERFTILAKDDPDAVAVVRAALLREGVDLREGVELRAVAPASGGVEAVLGDGTRVVGSHLLVAAGRAPAVDGLGLEAAGVAYGSKGVEVDSGLRTTNRRVLALGDVAGGPQFTHAAGYQAGVVLRRTLFGLPAKLDYAALPWVTYADPELAHVGVTHAEARARGLAALDWPLAMNDRAQTERATEGFVRLFVGARRRILGAVMVAPHAGEAIGLVGLAISRGLGVDALAGMVAPYPTFAEAAKRAAGAYFTPTLFGPRTRALVGLLQRMLP